MLSDFNSEKIFEFSTAEPIFRFMPLRISGIDSDVNF